MAPFLIVLLIFFAGFASGYAVRIQSRDLQPAEVWMV
ncbi:hypothetical protein ACVWZ4_000764 [Bradyrhizobium sp. USDA 4472]